MISAPQIPHVGFKLNYRRPVFIPNDAIKFVRMFNSIETVDILGRDSLSFIPKREVVSMQAYCVKCRAKREMKDTRAITMKNGKPATQGVCPVCGTKMFRIGKG